MMDLTFREFVAMIIFGFMAIIGIIGVLVAFAFSYGWL